MLIKNQIVIRKKIPAKEIQQAMNIIKSKYPYAKLITYKMDENFVYKKGDWSNRTITVAFIKNFLKIKELL